MLTNAQKRELKRQRHLKRTKHSQKNDSARVMRELKAELKANEATARAARLKAWLLVTKLTLGETAAQKLMAAAERRARTPVKKETFRLINGENARALVAAASKIEADHAAWLANVRRQVRGFKGVIEKLVAPAHA